MLSRSNRVPRQLFPTILGSRSFKNSPHFTLRIGEPVGKTVRIAVSVSKKISKSAVTRNTIRRRVYSVLRSHIDLLTLGTYLLVAKNGADKVRGEDLTKEMKELLNSIQKA